MKQLAILLLLLASTARAAVPNPELIGIWQCTDEIAAGWNEVYRFFPDGKVIWNSNQMDMEKRLLERRGTWVLEGDLLKLKFTEEVVLVGGRHIEAQDGESAWEGAKEVTRKLKEPLIEETTFKKPAKRGNYPSLKLFDRRFWRMKDDPADYL